MDTTPTLIELRAGRARLGVAPSVGGSIAYFRWHQDGAARDWLRPAAPADVAAGSVEGLACFPLVPFSNRIRDGRFAFRGRDVALAAAAGSPPHALHGHGWRASWDVVARAADCLTLQYEHNADAWPFRYRAREDFVLTADTLQVTLSIENRGTEAMPAGLGLHPYFPRTRRCTLAAPVAAMWATDAEAMPTALVAADPRLSSAAGLPVDAAVLDNVFTGWHRHATIRWPEDDASLDLDADRPLSFLVVYSPRGERFFCAEPVSHCTDAFNLAARGRTDTGTLALAPGASVAATVCFRPRVA